MTLATKSNIAPSITLIVDIPTDLFDSGKVLVSFKDAAFDASSLPLKYHMFSPGMMSFASLYISCAVMVAQTYTILIFVQVSLIAVFHELKESHKACHVHS